MRAGRRVRLYRFDEVDTLMVLGNVLIPWEEILFYRHTRAASFIRATLHRYSTFEDVCRTTGGYGERVERPEDLPAAIERSLTVMPRARATRSSPLSAVSSAETNLLAASARA
jgi:hypothetical protein